MITPAQWRYMRIILQNDRTTESMKEKIQYILYHRHIPLIHSIVRDFRQYHKFKSEHIQYGDYEQQASIGLLHAIKKYNGHSLFHPYAKMYIIGALYNCLTKQYPIQKSSTATRRKRKNRKQYDYETCGVQNTLVGQTWYLGKYNSIPSSLQSDTFGTKRDMWILIDSLPPNLKRILYYKFDYDFNIINSNRKISAYFACSEETIRQKVKQAILNIIQSYIYSIKK
jgi:RNA polymerase sigma factor (sigma-70 family)